MKLIEILFFHLKLGLFIALSINLGNENIYNAKISAIIFMLVCSIEIILRIKTKILD
ncbi:hypothetical protein STFE110948_02905 [Streptobacillus felis]|uniref:hypothetical protein n=1 Tax=Streptobacillus felis TaxID=1384509 RepID=UPI000AD975F9|nr:hypothetical protein [Streptobacillus felis]